MVTVKIYLSTISRLKLDNADYDTKFSGGNLALFSKIVEKDSYKITQGFSYGSTPKTSTFACKISAKPYYIKAFEAYDAIKVTKVKNGTETTVFLGCKPTIKRTYETKDWWSETITFNDYTKDLKDIVFHEKETITHDDGTTEDVDWSWAISQNDGYKVCNPSDTSHSLVHYLFERYLNKDRGALSFTINCTFSNLNPVTHFLANGEDKVLETWQNLLKQQGLAYYVVGLNVYIIDILADVETTATTVSTIECDATVNEKPYIDYTIPALRIPTIETITDKLLYDTGKVSVKPKEWYPSDSTAGYAIPSYSTDRENVEVARYYNVKWIFSTLVDVSGTGTVKGCAFYLYNGNTKVRQGTDVYPNCTGLLSGDKLKYAVLGQGLVFSRVFRLALKGDVDLLNYNIVKKPPKNELYSGDEEKAKYIFTDAEGDRYMSALLYSRDMEAKTYNFYSIQDLPLNSVCILSNISEATDFIRITDKQDALDAFEGYTYTATVYSGEKVTADTMYISPSFQEPNVSQEFNFSVSRSLIACDSEGTPLDTTAITARISLLKYYDIPTLYLDDTELELVQDTKTEQGDVIFLDSWHYDIPVTEIGTTSTLKAQLGDMVKYISIGKVNNGSVGSNGWSQATVNLYKRSNTEQTAYDGEKIVYQFSTAGLTGNTGSWQRTVPSGSEKLWVISASAFAQATQDDIEVSDWTTPAVLSENGTVGQDGYTVMTVILYQRSGTAPSTPSVTATYNFVNRTITNVSPWVLTIPEGTLPLWVTTATASTRNTVDDDIEPSEWATPQILVKNGDKGEQGIQGEKGEDGSSITIVDKSVQYASSTSGTATPSSWDSEPSPVKGQYLWSKTYIKYSDGTENTSYAVAYIGTDGTDGEDGKSGLGMYRTLTALSTSSTSVELSTIATKPNRDWQIGDMIMDVNGLGFAVTANTLITATTISIGYRFSLKGATGDTGATGYSIVASVTQEGKTEDWWSTYAEKGHEEEWADTESTRNGCRVGDLFTVVGTSTTGKAHIATYKSTTASGNLKGTCISHVYADVGTPALVAKIKCDRSFVTRNDRLSTSQTINFEVDVQGYSGTVALTINNTAVTLTNNAYAHSVPYKNTSAITAVLTVDDIEKDSVTLGVVDETERTIYIGMAETLPTTISSGAELISGDSVFISNDETNEHCIYVYGTHNGTLGWYKIVDYTEAELGYEERGTVLAKAMSDALAEIPVDSYTGSEYGYFKNLITEVISATYISTMNLKLQNGGTISSSNISTDKTLDVDTNGFLTNSGFRLEDTGALRANDIYLGLSAQGTSNKVIFDNTSLRCIDSDGNVLWALYPDGTAVFNSKVSANDLTAQGSIKATSLDCDAITTQDEITGNSYANSSFAKELFLNSTMHTYIKNQYLNNTIPVTESAFASANWTYNGKTVDHVALGMMDSTGTITGQGTAGRSFELGKTYTNSMSISAGDGKNLFLKTVNNYNFPIWVLAEVSLPGNYNEIHSSVYFGEGDYIKNGEDVNAMVCLMPGQWLDVYASSTAWWGTQTATSSFKVTPSFNNLCFIQNPVEVTSLRRATFSSDEDYYTPTLFTFSLPSGHPSTIVLLLNGLVSGTSSITELIVSTDTEESCYIKYLYESNKTWVYTISNIQTDATTITIKKVLNWVEETWHDAETWEDANGNVHHQDAGYTYTYYKKNITFQRLVYAIAYNGEAHEGLIRYDDGSLQYVGTKNTYSEGNLAVNGSTVVPLVANKQKTIYDTLKAQLGLSVGEYELNSSTSTMTINGTTYSSLSRVVVSDVQMTFYSTTGSYISIVNSGYQTTGGGDANGGGYVGNVFTSITVNIQLLSQVLGAKTATLYPKSSNLYDLGSNNAYYRSAYICSWNITNGSDGALTFTYGG